METLINIVSEFAWTPTHCALRKTETYSRVHMLWCPQVRTVARGHSQVRKQYAANEENIKRKKKKNKIIMDFLLLTLLT